jgi:hypothetical protein
MLWLGARLEIFGTRGDEILASGMHGIRSRSSGDFARKGALMKRPILLLLVFLTVLAAGCASSASGPPLDPARVAETEVAIRGAENAGAAERASDLLARAQKALANARQASTQGNYAEARAQLEEAKAFAGAAEARARAEKARAEAARLKQQADELEAKTKQLREQAQAEGRNQ